MTLPLIVWPDPAVSRPAASNAARFLNVEGARCRYCGCLRYREDHDLGKHLEEIQGFDEEEL